MIIRQASNMGKKRLIWRAEKVVNIQGNFSQFSCMDHSLQVVAHPPLSFSNIFVPISSFRFYVFLSVYRFRFDCWNTRPKILQNKLTLLDGGCLSGYFGTLQITEKYPFQLLANFLADSTVPKCLKLESRSVQIKSPEVTMLKKRTTVSINPCGCL